MEQGFILDKTDGNPVASEWAPGAPTKSYWFGLRTPRERVPVGVFRCASCGYLESYARAEFATQVT
jgi:hypothetical protein